MEVVFLLVGILVAAFGVVGWLFYSLRKEGNLISEQNAVAITDVNELKAASNKIETSVGDTQEMPASSSQGEKIERAQECVEEKAGAQEAALESSHLSQDQVEVYESEVRQLKDEVKLIREKAVIQARNALEVINKLRELNDGLRQENQRLLEKGQEIPGVEDETAHLRAENAALHEEAKTINQRLERAMEEISTLKRQVINYQQSANDWDRERSELNNRIQESSNKTITEDERLEYKKQLEKFYNELEAVQRDNTALKIEIGKLQAAADESEECRGFDNPQEKEALLSNVRELEAVNSIQSQKNEFLLFELTKSRAQAAGLERVCENSKKQLEMLTRQLSEFRTGSAGQKRNSDVLEKGLEEFKRLNQELVKREKLSQFEMELNQGQIEDLERIFQGFRSRLDKIGLHEKDLAGN